MENKPWYTSKTVWGTVVVLVAAVVPVVKQMGTDGVTDSLTNLVIGVAAVIGAEVAIIGR